MTSGELIVCALVLVLGNKVKSDETDKIQQGGEAGVRWGENRTQNAEHSRVGWVHRRTKKGWRKITLRSFGFDGVWIISHGWMVESIVISHY